MKYKYWLACMVERIGIRNICRLVERYRDAREIFTRPEREFFAEGILTEAAAKKLALGRAECDWESELEKMREKGIRLVTIEDEEYPRRLKGLPDAPYGLFVKGKLPSEENRTAAIIGARQCTSYGSGMAKGLGRVLASAGVQVVSGMAKGIDSAGHWGALEGGGRTYAVLGCGADICYPSGNIALYQRLEEEGGLISEYPPGSVPLPVHFPMRNRIISGLSDIVIVAEAKIKSGSLITADLALEQGRDVYAVPGRIGDERSYGTNRLIKQGAGMILSQEDFLKDLQIFCEESKFKKKFSKNSLEKGEMLVYSVLDLHSKNINEIIDETNLSAVECMCALAGLEEKGYIRETFQNYYVRRLEY